jgi:uncharacterized protein YbbC (DUF1343 family)
VGAPWLAPQRVIDWVRRAAPEALTGVAAEAHAFTPAMPTDGKFDGLTVPGIRLRVTDRARYDPTRLAVALLAAVRAVHPDSLRFRAAHFDRLAAGDALRQAVAAGAAPRDIWASWEADLGRFRESRAKYLAY